MSILVYVIRGILDRKSLKSQYVIINTEQIFRSEPISMLLDTILFMKNTGMSFSRKTGVSGGLKMMFLEPFVFFMDR